MRHYTSIAFPFPKKLTLNFWAQILANLETPAFPRREICIYSPVILRQKWPNQKQIAIVMKHILKVLKFYVVYKISQIQNCVTSRISVFYRASHDVTALC